MPAAGRSSISAHRRSLMTATAAGAVLCALWFVPSAKATPEAPGASRTAAQEQVQGQGSARGAEAVPGTGLSPGSDSGSGSPSGADWADGRAHAPSAAADAGEDGLTSPFVLSSLGLAGTGAVLIVRARRRAASGPRA